jgi:transposase-like protein
LGFTYFKEFVVRARKLPESILELVLMWELCNKSFAAAARHYEVDESTIRHRINAYLDSIGAARGGNYRTYSKLPLEELDQARKQGTSWAALAREHGVNQNSLRKAVERYRKRKERII